MVRILGMVCSRLKLAHVFKIRHKGKRNRRTNISNLQFTQYQAKIFYCTCTTQAAISGKAGGLIVHLKIQIIKRIF